MIKSRYMAPFTAILMVICLIACGFMVYAANAFDTANVPEYQKKLFGDEVISIDVQVDKDEWQGLLDNSQLKEWISGDLIINGERFTAVGIRTKGNSSLSQVASSDGITEGVYGLVRHPMYLGAVFLFAGTSFLMGSMFGLAFGVLLTARSVGEEKMLIDELEGYKDYKKKVKYRLIPFIW